ncbi:uncharacterized protein LOC117591941 [Drosophila guanche]|uniref:Blast:Protein brown n=1 Tax=Drosophila guanche TaxID=7266 RepID=A0A3B0J1H8_DROGU|nr:uncharacterized protein LOC117591941 [Drosophila guanche]XP_034141244.1 uncharacterized protein LOC117591941 [Drosophila guanche]SPP74787.1 blast:Protein brown [Drosophila guanche]
MAASNSLRHKINNSYESEPSTGSGSSLSENNEGHISDDEHMNLPYLMKLKSLRNEPVLPYPATSGETPGSNKIGSQDSQFRSFSDSPYGQVNKRLYGSQVQELKLPEIKASAVRKPSPGRIAFPQFYDTLMEENSCNAVDMAVSVTETATTTTDGSCLSFDGKIKSLTERPAEEERPGPSTADPGLPTVLETSLNTSQHKYNNERSPDLFADSDDDAENADQVPHKAIPVRILEDLPEVLEESQCVSDVRARRSLTAPTESSFVDEQTQDASTLPLNDQRSHFLENCRRERELYRRIRRCLQGVRPPPTVTTPDVDVITTVLGMKEQVLNFLSQEPSTSVASIAESDISNNSCSLFRPTHSLSDAQNMGWREVLGVRQHGLSYNLNKAAEQNEYLSMSVVDRYVGVETATSYVRSPSSAKKRNMRMKMLTQSPGNRLSHLAKRRAIFSSANLATNSLKLNSSIGPQILLDTKKVRNKRKATPKRKTPGSKKKARKTPSSSARKRLCRTDLIKPGPSRETSKRALFQSPAKTLQQQQQLMPPKPLFKPEIANRVEKSKRALFSPDHQGASSCSNHLETLLKRKRTACDDEDAELASQSRKLFRADSNGVSGLTPRALKIKSQSFCIGAGSSTAAHQQRVQQQSTVVSATVSNARFGLGLSGSSSSLTVCTSIGTPLLSKLQRAHSEMSATPNSSMTDNQRKKLLWAVSQALQERKITSKHESFRQLAADLTRVVKRIFQEFYLGQTTSNSETLLRLAKKFAYSVIAGKNADDVYMHARSQESEAKRLSSTRLSGYIGPEEFAQRKLLLSQATSCSSLQSISLFGSENSIDAFGVSQTTACTDTQTSLMDRISEDLFSKEQQLQQPIRPNPTLQNSSSKSNLGGLALRENVDGELRRSAQKNFTGKDQRNISPYYGGNGSARKFQVPPLTSHNSGVKAKRQISFDS